MKNSRLWDLYARIYDALPVCFPPYRDLLDRTLAAIQGHFGDKKLRALDAGCGTGNYAVFLARAGHDVSAIDMSQTMLDRCARKADAEGLRVALSRASLDEPLPFADATFDVVININALYMLSEPKATIAEFARVTRPGGVVITVNPQMEFGFGAILKDTCKRYGYGWLLRGAPLLIGLGLFNLLIGMRLKKGDFFYWDKGQTEQALTDAGLEVVSVSPAYTADIDLFAISRKPAREGADENDEAEEDTSPPAGEDCPDAPGETDVSHSAHSDLQ